MSKDERQELIKQIYCDALERGAGEREAFLAEACAGDEDLRREVETLLGYETEAVNFIETPALNLAAKILAEQSDAKIGSQIGAYKIISKLGAGGMGEVYLAEDARLRRKVALKLLPAQFVADSERVRRFEREARAASALNHPNILTIYEIGQTSTEFGDVHFIATEFVEGQTLRKRLLQNRLSVSEALDVVTQMAGALQAAHAAGIIHRDIKPENVMLRPDGYVKVLDFGLARITQRDVFSTAFSKAPTQSAQTDPGLIMGTVGYMSPEQVRGEELDQRTDIFSLGITLYEMLAGDKPFKGATTADAIAALLHKDPPPLSTSLIGAPAELQRIVNRALEKDCATRYQRCDEMLADLKAIREEMEFEQKLRSKEKERTADYTTNVLPARSASAHRRLLRPLPIVAFATAVLLAVVGGWFYRRAANQKWARNQIPLLEKLAREQKYSEAYDLATQVKKYLPDDPTVASLAPSIVDDLSVASEPAGARVYLRRFLPDSSKQSSPREFIGETPINKFRIARGQYILSLEKEGYATFERTIFSVLSQFGNTMAPPDEPSDFKVKLIEKDKLPDRMVYVPGGAYRLVSRTKTTGASVELSDFFIDKYEVTNREYKEFINAGGYFKTEYWKHPFVKDGRTLKFEEAMAMFRDRTGLPGPREWLNQNFPEGKAEHPVTGVTWHEAAAYAAFRGKQLPTIFQWEKAARNGLFTYYSDYSLPWGWVKLGGAVEGHANFNSGGAAPVTGFEFGMSPFGAYQMAGNASEWCLNETPDGFTVAGGSWKDVFYLFSDIGAFPGFHNSERIGFRCALNSPEAKGDQGAKPIDTTRQVPVYTPTSEAYFNSMLSHYRYDKSPLDAQVVETTETAEWRREKISYLGANDERALAYLYLPKSSQKPFQTIQFVPAGDVYGGYITLAESVEMQLAPFIRSGRAVWAVVLKGFKEREHPPGYQPPRYATVKRREQVVANATDLSRSLDYLATRTDIDLNRLAYYGYSRGAQEGLVYAAVENRYRSVALVAGGIAPFSDKRIIAEAAPSNFAPHIKASKLLLNGRYDEVNPLKTQIEPLFKLLREPKRLYLYDSGHTPPFEIIVPVINGWLDETLGAVRRF
jgi:serine/threonine protein kinase/formylglycine-generating enzyme required for sulfatase activity